MATHSSVLAWRIPETGEPGGLPSMGSHRVGHDWSDLAAAGFTLSIISVQFSSVHSLSRVWLCVILWIAAHQASLPITNSRSLLKCMSMNQWCHPTISSFVVPFSSHLQSFSPEKSGRAFSKNPLWNGHRLYQSLIPLKTQSCELNSAK